MPKPHSYSDQTFLRMVLFSALNSILAVVLLLIRFQFTHTLGYIFLAWNLFLAWIPVGTSILLIWLDRHQLGKWAWLLLIPIWLLFFPNTFYLVTDLMHLGQRFVIPLWFDTLLLFAFAWSGVILAGLSLMMIHEWLEQKVGKGRTWLVIVTLVILTSLGVYFGRFLRWNSWDVLTNPLPILQEVATRLIFPYRYLKMVSFTTVYSLFFLFAYLQMWILFRSTGPVKRK